MKFRTWLGYLNFYLLQWFFIRLARSVNPENNSQTIGFGFLIGIIPMTGWDDDYKFFPFKQEKYLRIWGE